MSKHWPAFVLIILGLIFIFGGLGYAIYQQRLGQVNPAPLPGELAQLPIAGQILGPPALLELSWMHGQEFQLNQGAVGSYGESGEITVYVAGTPLSFTADRVLIAMRDKIARADSPFTPVAEREDDQRTVYGLVGMGQQHFYFRSGNLIVWLAVNEHEAEIALKQVLEFYP